MGLGYYLDNPGSNFGGGMEPFPNPATNFQQRNSNPQPQSIDPYGMAARKALMARGQWSAPSYGGGLGKAQTRRNKNPYRMAFDDDDDDYGGYGYDGGGLGQYLDQGFNNMDIFNMFNW